MRPVTVLLIVGLAWTGAAAEGEVKYFETPTGPHRLVTRSFHPARLYTHDAFVEMVRWEKGPGYVEVRSWPEGLSEDVRYGLLRAEGAERTFVIERDAKGFLLTLDIDGDGDMTDERAIRMGVDTQPKALHAATLELQPSGLPLKLMMQPAPPQAWPERIFEFLNTERSGTIGFADRQVAFVLQGSSGHYDQDHDSVFFDFDGDGIAASHDRHSDERVTVKEGYVNLAGRSYGFEVAPDGSWLRLLPLSEKRADRVPLGPGNPAPDFSFRDIDGEWHRLSDYRGRIVLLYGWRTSCEPCRKEAPLLVEAYRELRDRGFEIIGVNRGDVPSMVREYAERYGTSWPQTVQAVDGPIVELYGIEATPTYFLLDRDGVIADREVRAPTLRARVDSMLAKP